MLVDEHLLRFGWGMAVLATMVTLVLNGAHPVLVLPLFGFLPHPTQLAARRDDVVARPQVPARPEPTGQG